MCGIHIGVSYLKAGLSLALSLFERRSVLRRILLVLTVGALMAAMMAVSAGPAQANDFDFGNSSNFVQVGDNLFGFGDIDDDGIDFDDGIFGFGRHHHHGIDFDGIDFDGNDGIFGFGGFSGIDQDSDSGRVSIGSNVS
jgi:hypothetical protein